MDREAHTQEINGLQDDIAAKHEKRIGAAIEQAWLDVARDLPTYARADLPLDHIRRVRTALEELYRDITRQTAAALVDQFKSGYTWLETKADEDDFYERLYEEYLSSYGFSSISQISEATRRQIRAAIERGLKEGLSFNEIADDLRERAPDISATRALIIARTETHSASMYASTQSAKRSVIPLVKEWVSVEDGRTRDFGEGDGIVDEFSHRVMNGVQVPLDDPYEVPMSIGMMEKLMFPGDPAGSAANVINCRCSQVYKAADADELDAQEDIAPPAPKPLTRERPTFRYQTEQAPKANYAALEAFFEANEIADNVLLRSIPAAALAKTSLQFLEVKERFGLDPMYGFGTASRFKRKVRGIKNPTNALAAVFPITETATGRKALFHLPSTFGQPKTYDRILLINSLDEVKVKNRAKHNAHLQNPSTVDEVRNRAALMDERGDTFGWTIDVDAPNADEMISSTIYHEFGHVVHLNNQAQPQFGEDIDRVLTTARPRQNGWGALVSEYGTAGNKRDERHRDKEYVAETFALYMQGEEQHYRIHPELLAVFQRYDRASAVKSFRLQEVKRMNMKGTEPLADPNNGVSLIETVLNTPENERAKVRKDLLAAYTDPDKFLVEVWLDEALALEVVDTI